MGSQNKLAPAGVQWKAKHREKNTLAQCINQKYIHEGLKGGGTAILKWGYTESDAG
jgi:hypothetical protein